MTRYVVIHKDGVRVACTPSSPGKPFEWKSFDTASWDSPPGGVMTWEKEDGAHAFALMNGGQPVSVSNVREAA